MRIVCFDWRTRNCSDAILFSSQHLADKHARIDGDPFVSPGVMGVWLFGGWQRSRRGFVRGVIGVAGSDCSRVASLR